MTISTRPMRIQVRPGSLAERSYYAASATAAADGTWIAPTALAPGIVATPSADLIFRGGKVVPAMEFQNIYLGGGASWSEGDVESISLAIDLAMRDKRLNNVMRQYFHGVAIESSMRTPIVDDGKKPKSMSEQQVQQYVLDLFNTGKIKPNDLGTCIFNLLLPSGTKLSLDDASSLEGLGGFHGSIHTQKDGKKVTLYYSANVYSEILSNGDENGIPVFAKPWKNVVATLYHELNEFRTDADVNDAIEAGDNQFCGWTSKAGQEVGDHPLLEASKNLKLVFQEIESGSSSMPVQFMYSNRVHGAEGPVDLPG